jgi:hypothetical protein
MVAVTLADEQLGDQEQETYSAESSGQAAPWLSRNAGSRTNVVGLWVTVCFRPSRDATCQKGCPLAAAMPRDPRRPECGTGGR